MTAVEHPILFTGQMVRAILDGRKTMTRRVVKLPRWAQECNEDHEFEIDDGVPYAIAKRTGCLSAIECPYGQAGDRLWVRETWGFTARVSTDGHERWMKERDTSYLIYRATSGDEQAATWRPSIFMPRWASRITLEVTGVRVERLQEIGYDDCRAEGVATDCHGVMHIADFAELLDSINAKRAPWASNPWVWVLTFKRLNAATKE